MGRNGFQWSIGRIAGGGVYSKSGRRGTIEEKICANAIQNGNYCLGLWEKKKENKLVNKI